MSWKQRVKTYQEGRSVKVKIEEFGEIAFYPNRISQLQQLRGLSEVVMGSLGKLFADNRGDAEAITESGKDEDGFAVQRTTVSAVSPEILAYRADQQRSAIEDLFNLVDRRNLILIGEMLMDSMRDEFSYCRSRGPQEVEAFLFGGQDSEDSEGIEEGALDITLFISLMQGWIKANSKVFGQLGEKMVGLIKGRLQSVSGLEMEIPTSGPGSKTVSSQPSPTAGQSSD